MTKKVIPFVPTHHFANKEYLDTPKMVCPVCECDCMHTKSDPIVLTIHNYPVRGNVTLLPFWGECGHEFNLVFAQHKGMIFLMIDIGSL